MKKIEFGYENSMNPVGGHDGIGIKPGLLLTEADYYGTISVDDNNYVVAKVTSDEYNRFPQLLDKFIVRKALCDLYADGSFCVFLDQNENVVTDKLEQYFNNSSIKQYINSPEDIFEVCDSFIHRAPYSFKIVELLSGDRILSTSILSEVFNAKNEAIKNCHEPISQLNMSFQELRDGHTR